MNLNKYISQTTQTALAARVGVTQGMVFQWLSGRKRVAAEKVIAVSAASGWQVTPHELRPDIYPNKLDGMPADHQEAA